MLLLVGFGAILWGLWTMSPPAAWIVGGVGAVCGALIWYRATRGQGNVRR